MERRAITIDGIVQGVGFRPFVYHLAQRLQLRGFVRNCAGSVAIEVEGTTPALNEFLAELKTGAPPLAHIDRLAWQPRAPQGEDAFRIESSETAGAAPVFVSPDVAVCADCLADMWNRADRRYRYPFLNCTHCGPRLTIILDAPYDRQRTTMAAFAMCPACRAEYEDPGNRRFHAQPTCCPACGPRLELLDGFGQPVAGGNPLAFFVEAMKKGHIGAIKGLGGYHLACDAQSETAVAELRRRKHRDEKPFAVMVADVELAARFCEIQAAERALLLSQARPIVLLRKKPVCRVADGCAPGNPFLGIMLPNTPLHHLLLHDLDDIPLVMTSGNRSDEPIAYEDADAVKRLAGIADLFLTHNRPIHVRCDDSVTRFVANAELPLRRSRGYAPQPIALPVSCPAPILAVGGQLKGTFALGRDRQAFLSHHLGDLDHFEAYQAFERDITLYEKLFHLRPALLAHDLHPEYASSRYAEKHGLSSREGAIPTLTVQHHHAHMASCMAEHGLTERVIGVTFDGTGYGTDGAVWGGEFLVGDLAGFERAAHLRYVAMPGGDQAIREPWRMALAYVLDARSDAQALRRRLPAAPVHAVEQMLERKFNTPMTSSMGRLFDAVAVLAGLREKVSYEGQAAMELEWLASEVEPDIAYPIAIDSAADGEPGKWVIDTRFIIDAIATDVRDRLPAKRIARRFHSTVAEVIAAACHRIRESAGLTKVVLSGGVFMNVLLLGETSERLRAEGFQVYSHRRVPPNDGGLSLGQLAIAATMASRVEIL